MAACTFSAAFAGGLVTNTNQNAAFLRQMSQDATIDITGLYLNPAGTAFLSDGWHLSLNSQSAFQTRSIETTFPLFGMNVNTPGQTTHKFKGEATAPVIPSFQLSYNKSKWSINASFALGGGGGKCEFDNGLGSFEAAYAGAIYKNVAAGVIPGIATAYVQSAVPQLMAGGYSYADAMAMASAQAPAYATNQFATNTGAYYQGYSMDAYMKGRQYYFGLQLGTTYKVTDELALFAGVRGVYASCNYNGFVQDIKYTVMGATNSLAGYDLALNCDQTGFGLTPIVGIDWRINKHWNVAMKYEFKTKMRLKNDSKIDASADVQAMAGPVLGQFEDGRKVAADIPGILTLGAQYSPIEKVRLNAGVHYYLDQDATTYGGKHDKISRNTWEVNAGAEWDICKWITLSGAWQHTQYGLSDGYMSDLSFNVSNNMIGCGVRVNATKRCSIDLGYMHTFYKDHNVSQVAGTDLLGQPIVKNDLYKRTNKVFGLGVNLNF